MCRYSYQLGIFAYWPALLILLLASGCNRGPARPKTYPVTGVVTWQGQPVPGATVTFSPKTPPEPGQEGPQGATGITDEQGRYQLGTFARGDGAIPGDYYVTVAKYENQGGVASGTATSEEEYTPPDPNAPPPIPKNLLPERYANVQSSGLTFTVEAKNNTFDITLE